MRHRRFNEAFPYTYSVRRKSDGLMYHGVRVQNVRLGLSPLEDLGVVYFTSGKLKNDFKKTPSNYEWKIRWTFDATDEAVLYETKVNERLYKKPGWANSYGKYVPVEAAKMGRKKHYLLVFGVDHNSKIPAVVEKRKETFRRKFGVDNPSQSEVVKEKKKKTFLKRYGVSSSFGVVNVKQCWMNKFGVDNPLKLPEIKEKVEATNLKRYGVKCTFQSKVVIDKIHQKRKDMYIRLAEMNESEFSHYLKSISQHPAVQSQKIAQRNKGVEIVKGKG